MPKFQTADSTTQAGYFRINRATFETISGRHTNNSSLTVSIWETLKQRKKVGGIILTTHYMGEADILGDRVGIQAEGEV